jgi:alpha-tubulin suppressor-like RCC1 family protein
MIQIHIAGVEMSNYFLKKKLNYSKFKSWGQLGNNLTSNSIVPVAVIKNDILKFLSIISISTGGFHTCVIANDSNSYCWGLNE